ncbi:MAG: FMN-binding negative transcriptional regulator [Kiloniellales bacterium]
MYTPPAFEADGTTLLAAMLEENPLAALVTTGPDGIEASHLPLLYLAEANCLVGHLARANGQWRSLAGQEGLAIFLGHQAYISPSWYASKQEHGKVVPTWNYEAVHVYGRLHVVDDKAALLDLVSRLTERHEARSAQPWAVNDAPERFIGGQLKGIVGLRMEIGRIEAKRKLSQNRPQADRLGTIKGLRDRGNPASGTLADAMENLEDE